ncbi:MAG: HAD-IA family hydrolase [Candidatus Shapirobacteria bacterium]|nr:HAD-IA family hydrolase [Candidatus Shapirobacteria bacterium]
MIKFIYFDFGAVLVNYDDVFTKVCNDFNLNRTSFFEFYDNFVFDMDIGKNNVGDFWKECIKNFNLKNASEYNLSKSWVSDYKIIKPIFNFISSLEGKVNFGIISNIPAEVWWAAFESGWVPKVKYNEILLSSDVGITKPDRKIYEIAQNKSGVNSEEILFIDDKEENLKEPKEIGWKTILFDMNKAEKGVDEIKTFLK